MRTIRHILLAVGLVLLPVWAQAQTIATATTLAAALAIGAQTMTVTSATGFTVGNYAMIDAEAVQISSITGTAIGIQRGQLGTVTQAHANAERVYTGVLGHFQQRDPSFGAACTRGQGDAAFQPWFNALNGVNWVCLASGVWNGTKTPIITYNSTQNGSAG